MSQVHWLMKPGTSKFGCQFDSHEDKQMLVNGLVKKMDPTVIAVY